ncbi:MAG: hypothetical protein ABGZ24_16405 [Fuerstiella sp.]
MVECCDVRERNISELIASGQRYVPGCPLCDFAALRENKTTWHAKTPSRKGKAEEDGRAGHTSSFNENSSEPCPV